MKLFSKNLRVGKPMMFVFPKRQRCLREWSLRTLKIAVGICLLITFESIQAQEVAEDLRKSNRQLRFDMATKAIQQAWDFDDLASAKYWLDQQRPRAEETDLRGFEWDYFNRLLNREAALTHPAGCYMLSASPDGRQLVSLSDRKIFVWNLKSKTLKTEFPQLSYVDKVTFSNDGKLFATATRYISGKDNRIVGLYSSETYELLASFPSATECFFSRDNRLAALVMGSEIQVYDLQEQKETVRLRGHSGNIGHLCFTPDSSRIATGSIEKTARCWDSVTGEELGKFEQHQSYVDAVDFGENGSQLITATRGGPLSRWDVSTGEKIDRFREVTRFGGGMGALVRSPDSRLLAVVANYANFSYVDVWDVKTGMKVHTLQSDSGQIEATLTFSPDGEQLATADYMSAYIWKVADQTRIQTVELRDGVSNPPKFYRTVAFHPDGRSVFAGRTNAVAQIDIESGTTLASFDTRYWKDSNWNLNSSSRGNRWHSSDDEAISVAVSRSGCRYCRGSRCVEKV